MKRIKYRSLLLLILDLMVVVFSMNFSMLIRYEFMIPRFVEQKFLLNLLPRIILIYLIVYKIFKLDKTVWVKVSIDEAFKIFFSNLVVTFILITLRSFSLLPNLPYSVIVMSFFIIVLIQFGIRVSYRLYRIMSIKSVRNKENTSRVLVYGAGSAGQMIVKEIMENENYSLNVVGFIDDNQNYKGNLLYSLPIFGGREILPKVLDQYAIDQIILAMPSLSLRQQKKIISDLLVYQVDIRTVSSSKQLLQKQGLERSLRKIDISDLLDRPEIVINDDEIAETIMDKKILITGAGGSIGSELARQIVLHNPNRLVLLDINETGLYNIEQELNMLMRDHKIEKQNIKAHIASIRDKEALNYLFEKEKFDLVFHAAAHKHVPLMEAAPDEAIINNIFGTKNLIDVSKKYNVEKFINISTDKAVNPTNVMGATKRFNEMMLQSQNQLSQTSFAAVRFGNVLGSNGSAVPLFRKQIENGGPVTVTHKEIERYFMTIPEAVSLVLQAASYAQGGEIFVLDMGQPVKILHLAEKVIELSGYRPYEDIDIVFTGLRPGEKLYEELLMDEENLRQTDNELIHVAQPMDICPKEIDSKLKQLEKIVDTRDNQNVIDCLKEVVPTYISVD